MDAAGRPYHVVGAVVSYSNGIRSSKKWVGMYVGRWVGRQAGRQVGW